MEFVPYIVIMDGEGNPMSAINLQIDDVGKDYELECIIHFDELHQTLINNTVPSHQFKFTVKSISKLSEQVE